METSLSGPVQFVIAGRPEDAFCLSKGGAAAAAAETKAAAAEPAEVYVTSTVNILADLCLASADGSDTSGVHTFRTGVLQVVNSEETAWETNWVALRDNFLLCYESEAQSKEARASPSGHKIVALRNHGFPIHFP